MANSPVKVLFSGSVDGDVSSIVKKIETVNKKSGPFDALFCVGDFFGAKNSFPGIDSGQASMPVDTYFLGAHGPCMDEFLNSSAGCKFHYLGRSGVTTIKGLTVAYLDGTYCEKSYHRVASEQASKHFCEEDVQRLKDELNRLEGEVDVLLTCEWPTAISAGVPESMIPEGLDPSSSRSHIVAEIAVLARPRYHFAGGEKVHLARLPFINRDIGAGVRITRFIGLAPIAGKPKSLHALSLVPAATLEPEQLSAQPEGSTPSPLEAFLAVAANKKRQQDQDAEFAALPNGGEWRWQAPGGKKPRHDPKASLIEHRQGVVKDSACTVIVRNVAFAASESDIERFFSQAGQVVDIFRGVSAEGRTNAWISVQFADKASAEKAVQLTGEQLMDRTVNVELSHGGGRKQDGPPAGTAVSSCWFCLGGEKADIGLVASVGEEAYIAVDKGAINDTHVLVIPVDHYSCSAALKPETFIEVDKYLSALRSCYAAQGRELVAFERYLALRKQGGNHCHINAIGVPRAAAEKAKAAFLQAASDAGFSDMVEVPPPTAGGSSQASLRAAVGDNEYFQAILPGGVRLVKPIQRGERWPMNLGRDVMAQLAGVPDRADWKLCAPADSAEEEARTERFKSMFKKYDIMQ